MKITMRAFLFAIPLLLASLPTSGQSLADVLSSIQERKRAVEQSRQVAQHLPSVREDPVWVEDQELIEWLGLESNLFPTDQQVDELDIGERVALLNQAIKEFRDIQGLFANLRKEDLVSGEKIGVLRPFLHEDFADLGRADSSNYHAVLAAIARDVRRLAVRPWPLGGLERRTKFWVDRQSDREPEYLPGSVQIEDWQPESLPAGDLVAGPDQWGFSSADAEGAWGSFLNEKTSFYAYSDTYENGEEDVNILKISKSTYFHSEAALFSKVPSRGDQLDGKVAVVIRNEWSPIDMTEVSVSAPNSWDPGDCGYEVVLSEVNPSSQYSLGSAPEISIDLEWVTLGKFPGPNTLRDGMPFGFDASMAWLQGPADPEDEEWLASWENQQEIGPATIAPHDIKVFRRQIHGLCAPTFVEGLDGPGKAANLAQAEKFSAPPAGDGKPVLHPVPGVLLGIPVGVGLDGSTHGFVGFSSCDAEACGSSGVLYPRFSSQRLVTRFDYAANLRFIGPAQDFHVVYATGRDATARGAGLPENGPTDEEFEDTGNVSFFDAWDAPRLRQVISRDLIIDITPMGHFKTQVRVFRRPADAAAEFPTAGEIASLPAGGQIRTLIFENLDAASEPYPETPEKVHVTEGTTIHQVWRDGYPDASGNPDPAIRFSMMDGATERFSKVIAFPVVGEAVVTTMIDGLTASVEEIDDSYWVWWDGIVPESVAITQGGQTTTIENTFNVETPGSQGGRYPETSTITISDEPEVSLVWKDSGVLHSQASGPWSLSQTVEDGALKSQTKLNGSILGTTWLKWSNGDRTVQEYAAPDGSMGSMDNAQVLLTELDYGNSTGTGLPGLPRKLLRKNGLDETDGSGTLWNWTAHGDGSTSVEINDGLIAEDAIAQGTRTVVDTNKRGYLTSTESYLILGGEELQTGGSTTPPGLFSTWGAPLKAEDFGTGLESTVAYDSQRERLANATDALGNLSKFSDFDAFDRPATLEWKGHSGGVNYNNGGFGVASSLDIDGRTVGRSQTRDASGRTTGGSVTSGGTRGFDLAHAAAGKTLTTSDSVTGANHTQKLRVEDGTVDTAKGTTLPFKGTSGDGLIVDGGLLLQVSRLMKAGSGTDDAPTQSFSKQWTDAWGRVRKTEDPSTAGTDGEGGAADDITEFFYSPPAATTKRVEIRHASGRRVIRETEPWAANGIITRSGIDRDKNGTLEAGDRFLTTIPEIVDPVIRTTVTQTGNATALMVREFDPETGITTTTLNGGEDTITETPDFGAKTSETTHKRGTVLVSTKNVALNHLGQADLTEVSGTGIAATEINPVFRDDGSVASFSVSFGGATSAVSFHQDGRIAGMTHPVLGPLAVSHAFANGVETLTVNGTTATRALDGTASSVSGAGVMAQGRATGIEGQNFVEAITPATGAATSRVSNPAGAKTGHDYAAGADLSSTWLAGGLPHTSSLGRGGNLVMAYTNDGARDLKSITWPTATSAGFAEEPFYGGVVGFTERDGAGNVTAMSDRSGARSLAYLKNRLTTTDWLSGELDAYKVVRGQDGLGRPDTVTVFRNGAPIHQIQSGYNGNSDEISAMTAAGFAASYGRDAASRLVTGITRAGVTQTWGRGTAGRITSADSNATGAPSFSYSAFDARGRRQTVVTNRGTWTYGYRGGVDGDGQLASASSTGDDLADYTYSFDGIGRRNFGGNQQDALNRFVAMTHPVAPKKLFISADPAADLWVNGVAMTPFNGGWIYDLTHPGSAGGWVGWTVKGELENAGDTGANPHAVAELQGQVFFPPTSESFSYDDDGNRESSALWDYGWDGRNRLVRARTKTWASAPEGWDLAFDYDAEGRRFKKVVTRYEDGEPVDHKVIHFVWDGWDLVYERHSDGNGNPLLERKYVWGLDISSSHGGAGGAGGLLLMRETRGQTTSDYYPLFDGSGHVVGLADATGNLVAEYWWGPFGELIRASGEMADANPWRYATKYYDVETGLYYFGHRYYDPVTGQWLNREPLGEDESLNLTSYCHNDPVNKVDVLGLKEQVIAGSAPVYATDPNDPLSVFIGFPLEDDRFFSPYKPNGKHSFASIPVTREAAALISAHPQLLENMRASASSQLDVRRLNDQVFYLSNSLQALAGTGEMAAGIAVAPQSAGVSLVATVHGADVAGTALNRLWYGPDCDIQSNTSQILQYIPGIDRRKAEIGDNLISLVTAGSSMYALGKAPLAYAPQPMLYTYLSPDKTPFRGDVFYTGKGQGRLWATTHSPGPLAFNSGFKNSFLRAWRAGRWKPFGSSQEITGNAAAQFSPVKAIGPFRGWKRAGGQYHTRTPGDLNLSDGTFLPATTKQTFLRCWDSTFSYGFDAGVMTSPLWIPPAVEAGIDAWYGKDE